MSFGITVNFGELTDLFKSICRNELNRSRGSFLTYFMEAYLRADMQNKALLNPVMAELVVKYRMKPEDDDFFKDLFEIWHAERQRKGE